MKKNFLSNAALFLAGALILSGCTAGENQEETPVNVDNETPVAAGLSYTEKWDEKRPQDMLFPRGLYSFTYREVNEESIAYSWSGSGEIGFYDDGTCAFDYVGSRVDSNGETVNYQLGKYVTDGAFLFEEGAGFWESDALRIESGYRTNFPSMGAFPRHKNLASFCSLQALKDITTGGNLIVGNLRWSFEGGSEYAKEAKEWFMDFNIHALEISESDKNEALEVLELMYYGADNIFTFQYEMRAETFEDGTVKIVNGVEGETQVFSEFILTPLASEELALDFPEAAGNAPATPLETARGIIGAYEGGGIGYLRYMKKLYEDFAAQNSNTETED